SSDLIAVDAANAGLADLGDLLEQPVRNLRRRVVGIDQDGETGRARFRRHGFPQRMDAKSDHSANSAVTLVKALANIARELLRECADARRGQFHVDELPWQLRQMRARQ